MTTTRITPRILIGILPLWILLVTREACKHLGNAANDVATRLGLWMRLDGDFWE